MPSRPLLPRWAWLFLALLAWQAAGGAWAQRAPAERVALVVGNGAYGEQALPNPANDARAMAALLGRAGFDVQLHTDTSREQLLQAIDRFGQVLREPRVRFAVFYYAGHGFQLDWRNYLVPVDARVRAAADVPRQAVEVGELLRRMNEQRGRNYLVILDACRDDPFAGAWRPAARGLSQFDAPVGSVLAYATAPGRVALDGDAGGNGLYTKHLVRELAAAETPLEDVFKRVRLAVRLESLGRQVPWEMASLEQSVFLFPGRRGLSDQELEARFEEELAAWTKARQSNSVAGLAAFIRAYPSGNVSELAQARLNRLLEEEIRKADAARRREGDERAAAALVEQLLAAAGERPAAASAAAAAPPPASAPAPTAAAPRPPPPDRPAAAPPAPAAPLLASLVPAAEVLPATPFFAGQHPHQRQFRVGDVFEHRVVDLFSQRSRSSTLRVTAVDAAADRVEFNGGEYVSDLMGNTTANPRGLLSTPRQFYPAELVVGKRWRTEFRQARPSGWVYHFRYDVKVAAKERITVPAGTFEAYRIEAEGFNVGLSAQIRRTIWVAPGVDADIAHQTFVRLRDGTIEQNDRQELVAYPRR